MITIPRNTLTTTGPLTVITEASDLNLAPGSWPNILQIEGDQNLFYPAAPIHQGIGEDLELVGMKYSSPTSLVVLTIIND